MSRLRQARNCRVPAKTAVQGLRGGRPLNRGRVPAARGRAVALCVEPLSKAQRLAPSGGHPSRGLAAALRARWRAGRHRTAARGGWPVRSPMQRSRLRLHRNAAQPGQAGCAGGLTTAARSRARGSRALFPSRVRERGPLDELTGVPFTPLRFVRCTPARSSPRSPAMPDAGPLNALK